MEQENSLTSTESKLAVLRKVTPLSKYLAMVLFAVLPFLGGWIGYQHGKTHNLQLVSLATKDVPTSELPQDRLDTSVLLAAILNLDSTKNWSIEYASNQSIFGEQSYNRDIVSGVMLTASTDVEGGRADTFTTPEGADYMQLATALLKEQGYEQVDFYEGRPGSFGSLFKLNDGLYLKLRSWTIDRDARAGEQGDFFGSVPRRFEYEIFITDINNPISIDQDLAVDEIFTDTLVPDAKIFFSNRHSVGFSYVSTPCRNDSSNPWSGLVCNENQNGVRVYEGRDMIYVGNQYISVYEKDPLMALQAAVAEKFLHQDNETNCSFEVSNSSLPDQYHQVRLIPNEFGDNSCEVNPSGVFLMNREVPDKFIYVIVGQEPYLPSGSAANPGEMWQESIRIID